MKKNILFLVSILFLVCFVSVSQVSAWFGAGRTPGWAKTTLELSGEMALPTYKFSPDFYRVGDNIKLDTVVFNETDSEKTFNLYLVVSRVIEAPKGDNVTDADPDNPGLNENQLYDFHQSNNDVQQIVQKQSLGSMTVGAQQDKTVGASYTPSETGYYQFDITHRDPELPYEPGHILTAGFFRVLASQEEPTPSPTPTIVPTATPTPTPTASPTPTPGDGGPSTATRRTKINLEGPSCDSNVFRVLYTISSTDGSSVSGKQVRFSYKEEKKTADSDSEGRAITSYVFAGPSEVRAESDGLSTQTIRVEAAQGCSSSSTNNTNNSNSQGSSNGSVLGATTDGVGGTGRRGKILGASTLAATGTFNQALPLFVFISSTLVLSLGLVKMWNTANEIK